MRTSWHTATPQQFLEPLGRSVLGLSIAAIGIETVLCAGASSSALGPAHDVIPIVPFIPAVPMLAMIFGAVWALCGACMVSASAAKWASIAFAVTFGFFTVAQIAPIAAQAPYNLSFRTAFFEPLTMAALACLQPAAGLNGNALRIMLRYIVAVALLVFGLDHFLALAAIATLVPPWIPFPAFWVGLFGVAFIATGVAFATRYLFRISVVAISLMFGIWVLTLHLPRTLGYYGIRDAIHDPAEWSSLFIALALCGGFLAVASADVGVDSIGKTS